MSHMYMTLIMMIVRLLVFGGIVLFITFFAMQRKKNGGSSGNLRGGDGYGSGNDSISRSQYVSTLDMIERMLRDGSSKESIIDYIEGKKKD